MDFKEVKEEFLTCPICVSTFDKPKQLQCLHSLCEKCLKEYVQNLVKTYPRKSSIDCPVCRKEIFKKGNTTTWTSSEIEKFLKATPDNFYVSRLLDKLINSAGKAGLSRLDSVITEPKKKGRASETSNTLPRTSVLRSDNAQHSSPQGSNTLPRSSASGRNSGTLFRTRTPLLNFPELDRLQYTDKKTFLSTLTQKGDDLHHSTMHRKDSRLRRSQNETMKSARRYFTRMKGEILKVFERKEQELLGFLQERFEMEELYVDNHISDIKEFLNACNQIYLQMLSEDTTNTLGDGKDFQKEYKIMSRWFQELATDVNNNEYDNFALSNVEECLDLLNFRSAVDALSNVETTRSYVESVFPPLTSTNRWTQPAHRINLERILRDRQSGEVQRNTERTADIPGAVGGVGVSGFPVVANTLSPSTSAVLVQYDSEPTTPVPRQPCPSVSSRVSARRTSSSTRTGSSCTLGATEIYEMKGKLPRPSGKLNIDLPDRQAELRTVWEKNVTTINSPWALSWTGDRHVVAVQKDTGMLYLLDVRSGGTMEASTRVGAPYRVAGIASVDRDTLLLALRDRKYLQEIEIEREDFPDLVLGNRFTTHRDYEDIATLDPDERRFLGVDSSGNSIVTFEMAGQISSASMSDIKEPRNLTVIWNSHLLCRDSEDNKVHIVDMDHSQVPDESINVPSTPFWSSETIATDIASNKQDLIALLDESKSQLQLFFFPEPTRCHRLELDISQLNCRIINVCISPWFINVTDSSNLSVPGREAFLILTTSTGTFFCLEFKVKSKFLESPV